MFFGNNLSNLTKEEWEKAIDYEIEWLNKEKLQTKDKTMIREIKNDKL
jgi:hypothetical protein